MPFVCLHFYLINIHIFYYPDYRLSRLFTEVPTSPDNRGSIVSSCACLKGEGLSKKRIFFCHHQVYIELSYSPKFQLLKCILPQEISLQRSPKFGICSRHFETNAQRPGRARPLSVTSCRSRDFVLARMFALKVMADTVLSQNVFLILRITRAKTKK